MSSNEIDIQKLCEILDVNSHPDLIKEKNSLFLTYRTLPKFGPLLLTIACCRDGTISNPICQGAAISLKNYITSNWKYGEDSNLNAQLCFDEDKIIVISKEDKDFIRKNILDGVIYIVESENVQILKQLNQCVKKILKSDYKDIWKNDFMDCVLKCINSQNQKQIYAGILLFYQLSKIYEFEDSHNQTIYGESLQLVNDKFIYFIDMCKGITNNVEAMILYKLYKMFLKNFQGSVPTFIQNNEVFKNWSNYLLIILKTPLNKNIIGDNKSIFWKLKRICFQIVTRIIQKYKTKDLNNESHNNFRQNLLKEYLPQYYEVITTIYSYCNQNQVYIDDVGKNYVYGFYFFLSDMPDYKQKVYNLFLSKDELIEEIIKDCVMPKGELETWVTSPKEYIAHKEVELNMFNTKKYRALKLFKNFMECKDKKSKTYILFDKLYNHLYNALIQGEQNLIIEENNIKKKLQINPSNESYLLNTSQIPYILRKESILFLLKKNSSLISKKVDTDLFIQKLIMPSLQSPCGLLREQACHFISQFDIKNNELLTEIIIKLCFLMEKDPQLPVRLYACIALGCCFEKETARNMIKGNVKKILEISLRLMEETDIEQIMDILQLIVKYFTEESQQYIIELSDYLIKYFMKVVEREKNMEPEDLYSDSFTIKNNIVTTFVSFIECFIDNPDIYDKIKGHIDTLIDYYLIKSDSPEESLDLIEAILKESKKTNEYNHILKFFVPLIQTVIGTDKELEEFNKNYKNQVFYGQGLECILDISRVVCNYIIKDPNNFLNLQDEKGVAYIVYVSKLIECIIQVSESKSDYQEDKYCLGIIMTLFECYKGKMDKLMNDLIEYTSRKIKKGVIKDKYLIQFLMNLISTCFIYDPIKVLNVLQNKNITKEIFIFWFSNLKKLNTKAYLKYNIMAICSILKIDLSKQDSLIIDNMKQLIESIFSLTKKINDNIEKEFETQEENEDEHEDYRERNNAFDKDLENINDRVRNIVSGEPTDDNNINDEDISYDEIDEEEEGELLTEFERINVIEYVKDTLNEVGKNPEMNRIIVESLGDKLKVLNDIFNREEERKIQKKKNS